MKIWSYWVTQPGAKMPAYISLCLATWEKHLGAHEVTILDHENMLDFIDIPDLERYKSMSLAMQSDYVKAHIIERFGGCFLDADTIVTGDFVEHFDLGSAKLSTFNDHWAFLLCPSAHNPYLVSAVALQEQKLLAIDLTGESTDPNAIKRADIKWDYLCNSISWALRNESGDYRTPIDAVTSGAILEAAFTEVEDYASCDGGFRKTTYEQSFFDEEREYPPGLREAITYDLVLLHNSWTPEIYRDMSVEQFLASRSFAAALTRSALGLADTLCPESSLKPKDIKRLIERSAVLKVQQESLTLERPSFTARIKGRLKRALS